MKEFSVTETLSPWANEKFQNQRIGEKVLVHASERGSLTHHWCLYGHLLGLYVPDLPEEYQGYGESFKLWAHEYITEVIWVEKELKNEALGIVGHPDLLCMARFKTEPILSLIDLKTPIQHSALWQLQLSEYLDLVIRDTGYFPEWTGSLMLHENGKIATPKKHEFATQDIGYFMMALQLRRYLG